MCVGISVLSYLRLYLQDLIELVVLPLHFLFITFNVCVFLWYTIK